MLSLMNVFLDDRKVPKLENKYHLRRIAYWLNIDKTITVGDLVAVELRYYFKRDFIDTDTYGRDTMPQVRKTVDDEMRKRGFSR